jgi:hypothetical protein
VAGYLIPLYRQPLFTKHSLGPYTGCQYPPLSPSGRGAGGEGICPNCERICQSEGVWLEQRMFLGPRSDMDDIAAAVEKVYENRHAAAGHSGG